MELWLCPYTWRQWLTTGERLWQAPGNAVRGVTHRVQGQGAPGWPFCVHFQFSRPIAEWDESSCCAIAEPASSWCRGVWTRVWTPVSGGGTVQHLVCVTSCPRHGHLHKPMSSLALALPSQLSRVNGWGKGAGPYPGSFQAFPFVSWHSQSQRPAVQGEKHCLWRVPMTSVVTCVNCFETVSESELWGR